jgi:hypothetical protein
MKTPRLEDFAQTPKRPIRELHSPLDDMPRIEKQPRTNHRPETPPLHDEVVVSPDSQAVSLSPTKTRTAKPAKRSFVRRSFDFYEDQVSFLTRVSLEERIAGREGSMNAMVREALDDYIQKKKATTK